MFERFTKEARQTVKTAVAEAVARGDARIGSEHLMVALAGVPLPFPRSVLGPLDVGSSVIRDQLDRIDSESLAAVGVDPDLLHPSLQGTGSTRRSRPDRHIPFTHGAKEVLVDSLREAIRLEDRHIGAEHVLLSLLSVPSQDPVARVFGYLDVDPAITRVVLRVSKNRTGSNEV